MDSTDPKLSQKKIDECLEYLDMGWSVIPIAVDTKKPLIKWKDLQQRQPTEEEITEWFTRWPKAQIALVTGKISGVYVVDMDNAEAEQKADELGFLSPLQVKTPHGSHRYFAHPGDDTWRGPQSGSSSNGTVWPTVNGLDWRGDGSYALLPTVDGKYAWNIPEGFDWDDMTTWQDYVPPVADVVTISGTSLNLDLSGVNVDGPRDIWEETAARAYNYPGGLIPRGGSGIYDMTFRYLAKEALDVGIGDELEAAGREYMSAFYEAPLEEARYQQNLRSIRQMEREKHPERFNSQGEYIGHLAAHDASLLKKEPDPANKTWNLITGTREDINRLIEEGGDMTYLINPILADQSIMQISGYSGHGKSLFAMLMMFQLSLGKCLQGYQIEQSAKVLYVDFENSRAELIKRLTMFQNMYGESGNIEIWTPWDQPEDNFNLTQPECRREFGHMIETVNPDVVVLDTVRSAFPGLEENRAESWAVLNTMLLQLRNNGFTVIFVHHTNKPNSDGTGGSEAGSANQVSQVEQQLRIIRIYEDKEQALVNNGLWNARYAEIMPGGQTPWYLLNKGKPRDGALQAVFAVRSVKCRSGNDEVLYEQYFGIGEREDGRSFHVSTLSKREKAKRRHDAGRTIRQIAEELGITMSKIKRWLGI